VDGLRHRSVASALSPSAQRCSGGEGRAGGGETAAPLPENLYRERSGSDVGDSGLNKSEPLSDTLPTHLFTNSVGTRGVIYM
jgi:hypothetical protein